MSHSTVNQDLPGLPQFQDLASLCQENRGRVMQMKNRSNFFKEQLVCLPRER